MLKILVLATVFTSLHIHAAKKSRYEELELFNKVLYLVDNQYYRQVDTEKLIEGAIKGMMDTLDPHSQFLNKEYFKKMQNVHCEFAFPWTQTKNHCQKV